MKIKTNNAKGYMDGQEGDGLVLGQPRARGVVRRGVAPTLNTATGGGAGVITEKSKVRILTPKEAWRLMGLCRMNEDGTFDDTNFEKEAEQVSSAQLYKQAGNSIVVDVLVNLYLSFLAPENKGSQTLIDQWGRKE